MCLFSLVESALDHFCLYYAFLAQTTVLIKMLAGFAGAISVAVDSNHNYLPNLTQVLAFRLAMLLKIKYVLEFAIFNRDMDLNPLVSIFCSYRV